MHTDWRKGDRCDMGGRCVVDKQAVMSSRVGTAYLTVLRNYPYVLLPSSRLLVS